MKTIFNIYWSVCLVMLRVSFVSTVSCPHLWDSVRRTYTYLQICIRRLPEAVTWFEGEQQCRNWMGNPLAWNETLDDINNEQNFDIQEPEIWSSLKLTNGKLFHSGAPMTTVGMFPFAPPEGPLVITWMSGQPVLGSGDCVMTTKNKTAKFSPCNDKKFMYCQRYPVDPFVKYEPSFCLDGYVGNVEWSKCYKLINDAATFAEASLKCQNEGASLTSIDDIIKTGVEVGAGTANEEMLKAAAIFFLNIINSNTSNPVNTVEFWIKDTNSSDNCSVLTYSTLVFALTIRTDNCKSLFRYMCEVDGKTKTDLEMTIKINTSNGEGDDIRSIYIYCELSRPLLPGEAVYISVNNRPTDKYRMNDFRYHSGNLRYRNRAEIYGIHRCEVTGLHNKQRWFSELQYQQTVPDVVLFMGSVGFTSPLPETEVLMYNMATDPSLPNYSENTPPVVYDVYRMFFNMNPNEIRETYQGYTLNGQFSTTINRFRSNGKAIEFQIVLELTEEYSASAEQETLQTLKSFFTSKITNLNTRNRRSVYGPFSFDPDSVIISSTLSCAGSRYYPEWGIEVNFPPVSAGLSVVSTEICITDKEPLATADCIGGKGQPTSLSNIVINPKCMFNARDVSPVTEILRNLTTVSVNDNNVHVVVDLVKNLTSDPTILTSIDTISVADVLVHVSKLPSIDERVVEDIFDIIDSVINVDVSILVRAEDSGSATNRLLEVVKAVSNSLDIGQKTGARFLRNNILMDVYDVSDTKSPVIGIQINTRESATLSNSTVQTIMSANEVTLDTVDAAIILPVEMLKGMNISTRVALNVYRNWNLFLVRSDIKQYRPNSRVIAASITLDGFPVHSLGKYEVQALFYPRMDTSDIVCGYWDYDLHEKSGGWATDGCVLNRTESGRFVCICDHLTNFAVLVNIGGQDTLIDSLALKIISYIGLILSIIGLSLTVLSFIFLKHLRKGRAQQTLFNLALSLLCFLIVFISGIEQTQDFNGCIAVAVLLHYFILVAFMWMLMEGILQYLRFVKVLGTYIPRFILKTAVPAWGVPLIPVIIVLAVDYKLYHGGSKACWMSLNAFYYSFVVPVSIIVLANIIIFIMILKNLLGRPKGLQSNQSEKKRAMMNLRAALSVLVLLGLTWIFGFFTIEGASVVFQYIFTILNVFQGFFIFVLFTAREKQARHGWKKLCCKQKSRDKYSKTDTSSNENKSKCRTDNLINNTKSTGIDSSTDSSL